MFGVQDFNFLILLFHIKINIFNYLIIDFLLLIIQFRVKIIIFFVLFLLLFLFNIYFYQYDDLVTIKIFLHLFNIDLINFYLFEFIYLILF